MMLKNIFNFALLLHLTFLHVSIIWLTRIKKRYENPYHPRGKRKIYTMEKKTKGAWLINHTKKLFDVRETQDFEDIEMAGKCGIFLSNLAASHEQMDIKPEVVGNIAKAANIKKTEIDSILNKLKESHLVDTAQNGSLSVLAVTTSSVLGHTTDIFNSTNPNQYQQAVLDLSENISNLPKGEKILKEYISDNYKLAKNESSDLFSQAEEIGFIDYEKLDDNSKLYFNGNLFRRGAAAKTNAVLASLKPEDKKNILELDELLNIKGCTNVEQAKKILGDVLLSKLQSIGMYDFNEVSNLKESKTFITKPSAFAKFNNPFEEDALDLAKAFVSSLYYGMNHSSSSRGRIDYLHYLMKRLVNGEEIGPATAIGQDYNVLVFKGVVKLRQEPGTSKFYMKLLKRDVGELAMQVLEFGHATEKVIESATLQSGSITGYKGPEEKRTITRKLPNHQSKGSLTNILRTLRS